MPETDGLVLDSSNQDGQRVVSGGGRFTHTVDKSDRLNPIFGVARASGIGKLRTSEDTVPFLEAIIKGHPCLMTTIHCGDEQKRELEPMYRRMMELALPAEPTGIVTLRDYLKELEGLADGRNASGKTHHERTD